MNIETDINSVSKSSSVSCITLEDDNDEIEVIDLDDEIEDDVPTYSFQENNASNTFIDTLNESYNNEDSNLYPLDDPLITDSNENNEEKAYSNDNDVAKQIRSRISLCSHKCYLKVSEEDQKKAYNEMCARKTQLSKFKLMSELIETQIRIASNRNFSKFFLETTAERKNICKMCFMCSLHITRDFLNLYFRYTFKFNKQSTKRNNVNSSIMIDEWDNLNTTINIIDEDNLDEDDTALRDKILQLGWKRIPECENMCSTAVPKEDQKRIFVSYWFKSTREERYKFISDMTDVSYNNSKITFTHYLYTNIGIVKVCKSCFSIAINETQSFIHQALKIKCFKLKLPNASKIRYEDVNTAKEIIDLEIPETDLEKTKDYHDKQDLNDKNHVDMENELKNFNSEDADNFDDIFETMENLRYLSVDNYLEDKYNIRLSSRGCGCYLNITRDNSKRSFYSYWKHKITLRINYIIDFIELPKNTWKDPKQAFQRAKFFFYNAHRKPRRICKFCFLSVLDISKIFLDSVVEEKVKRFKEKVGPIAKNKFDETNNLQLTLKNDMLIESKLSQGWIRLQECSYHCFTKVSVKDQERIFNFYWRQSTLESRLAFINDMVDSIRKKKLWHAFNLKTSKGRVRVCRVCFLSTINESKAFVLDALQKKSQLNSSQLPFAVNFFESENNVNFEIESESLQGHSTCSTSNDEIYNEDENDIDDKDDKKDDDTDVKEDDDIEDDKYIEDVKDNDDNNVNDANDEESTIETTNVDTNHYEQLLRTRIPLNPCSRGCHLILSEERQKEIFEFYWKNTTNEMRRKFVLEMTEVKPTVLLTSHIRYKTNFYFYTNTSMRMQKVCKGCFRSVLNERGSFIQKILDDNFISMKTKSVVPKVQHDQLINNDLEKKNIDNNKNKKDKLDNNKLCKCQTKSSQKWTPLLPCINDCHLKLTEIEQRNIFLAYWNEKLFDSRFNFINRRTELILQENCDTNSNKIIFRSGYYFVTHQGRQKVCKYCFYHILDVSKAFVSAIFNQKLYNMMKLNIIPAKPNMTFLFFDDETLQPRTSDSNELENQITCDNCVVDSEIKIKQGVQQLVPCNNLCYIRISKNDKNRVFYDYYCQEKTIEAREKFICDMLRNITIQFNKKTDLPDECQQNKMEFCLHTEHRIISICKTCFARLINESFEFIAKAMKNKTIKYEEQLKLKNNQIINQQNIKKNNKSDIKNALNHVENVIPNFLTVNTVVKSDDEFRDDNNLLNNTHQEVIEEVNSFNEVTLKMECVDETIFSDEDVELETDNLTNDENQDSIHETNECEEEKNPTGDEDVEMKSSDVENTINHIKIYETKTLNDFCTLKTESEEAIISPDKNEELKDCKTENNTNHKSIKETNSLNASVVKTEYQEENIVISAEDSKRSTLLPLKRKSRQISKEDNEESFLGLSIIKEELDLENEAYLDIEKYEGPPEKIAKENIFNSNDNLHQGEEKLNIQLSTVKQEPIVYKISLKQSDKIEGIKLKKKRGRGPNKIKKVIDPNFETKMKRTSNIIQKPKTRKEKFIEQEMEKILKKYGKETMAKVTNLTACEDPSEDDIKKVEEHIGKFPLCESYHYNGTNPEKYLPMGLTSKIMYDLYKQEVPHPVSNIWYNKLLEKTDLKFRTSFLTKCDVCSAFAIQYKHARDSSEKSKINSTRSAHLIDSEEANNSQSLDERTARIENHDLVCSFGFQQSLPTPYLNEPLSYYKQRLWTYNFTIRNHSVKKDKILRKFYLWYEIQGTRSINEIASCLYSYLKNLPARVTNVIFYSTCDELTINKNLASMFLYSVINHETLESVEHKFLISGHSQIEANLGSKNVQDIMNNYQNIIHEPNDWYEAFKKCTKDAECEIKSRNDFYNFDEIRNELFNKTHQFINEKNVKCLRYTKQGIYYKTSWSSSNRYQSMNLNGSLKILKTMKLKKIQKILISEKKKMDLLDLIPFLSTKAHNFYRQLLNDELIEDQRNIEINEKCQKINKNDVTILSDEISIIQEKCDKIHKQNDDIEEICIIENEISHNNVLPVNVQREMKNTKLLYENPHKNNEFQLVLIKEEEFEQT